MGDYADDDIDAGIDEMFGASAGDWLKRRRPPRRDGLAPWEMEGNGPDDPEPERFTVIEGFHR